MPKIVCQNIQISWIEPPPSPQRNEKRIIEMKTSLLPTLSLIHTQNLLFWTVLAYPALSVHGNYVYVTGSSEGAVSWYERNASTGALTYGGMLKDGVDGVDGLEGA